MKLNKKSFAFSLCAISLLLLSSCGDSSNKDEITKLKTENSELKEKLSAYENVSSTNSSSNKTSSDKDQKIYGLNEEAIIKDSSGNDLYSITLTNATTKISEKNQIFIKDNPGNAIELTFDYKNINNEEAMSITNQFITVYDSNSKAGKDTGYLDGQNLVTKGKSASSTTWFIMPEKTDNLNEIEVDYGNDFANEFEQVIQFKIPVEH